MIYSLTGEIVLLENNFLVINCSGVGYKCFVSENTKLNVSDKIGTETTIYTFMSVRQDAVDLFGFSTIDELECFKLLISVSGVGSKAALSILSNFIPEQISDFVSHGDSASLTYAAGIGKKTAQRIVLELKDKLSKMLSTKGNSKNQNMKSFINYGGNIMEAKKALATLGYSEKDIEPYVSKIDNNKSVEEIIRIVLKEKGV